MKSERCIAPCRHGRGCSHEALGGRHPLLCSRHLRFSERHGLQSIRFFGIHPGHGPERRREDAADPYLIRVMFRQREDIERRFGNVPPVVGRAAR